MDKPWRLPVFDAYGMTKWRWMCQYRENLILHKNTDIGAFTYINAKYGVEIEEDVQIGSHCSIYSLNTENGTMGKVIIRKNACIGSHCVIFPNVVIQENENVPAGSIVYVDSTGNRKIKKVVKC